MHKFIKKVVNKIRLSNLKAVQFKLNFLKCSVVDDQYTNTKVDNEFIITKLKNLHAFQIELVNSFILTNKTCFKDELKLIDFGDSSGNHILGLYSSLPKEIADSLITTSCNCDSVAIKKIESKNLAATKIDLCKLNQFTVPKSGKADIGTCFETLEHLINPLAFISELERFAETFIFTVPYVKKSRVGMHHLRGKKAGDNSEDLHIFELCPEDWKLLFKYFGWKPIQEKTYHQYPKSIFSPLYKMIWRYIDFEGFYGVIMKRSR